MALHLTLLPGDQAGRDKLDFVAVIRQKLDDGWVFDAKDMLVPMIPLIATDNDLIPLRDWLISHKHITADAFGKELAHAKWVAAIIDKLECVPKNSLELVLAYVKVQDLVLTHKEAVKRLRPKELIWNGVAYNIDEILNPADGVVPENAAVALAEAEKTVERPLEWLRLRLRMLTEELNLRISRDAISDAVETWRQQETNNFRIDAIGNVTHDPKDKHTIRLGNAEFDKAAKAYFDLEAHSAGFVAASLKTFMYQVKRKIYHEDVENHLMLLFYGMQGVGKSTFARQMLEPLQYLTVKADFNQIDDGKTINIFEKNVIFVDEMGFVERHNVDALKNLITAETVERRIMRENRMETFRQSAMFLGTSNRLVEQMFNDPTGLRRMNQLEFSKTPSWAELDFALMWRSVDHKGPSPMKDYEGELKARQEIQTPEGQVAEWASTDGYKLFKNHDGWINSTTLFCAYQDWEAIYYKNNQLNNRSFGVNMASFVKMTASPRWEKNADRHLPRGVRSQYRCIPR